MPRPTTFTAEMLARCDAEMALFVVEQRAGHIPIDRQIPEVLLSLPHMREAWFCGAWLWKMLLIAGCPDREARDICFANGQKCAMAADPWPATEQTLADYLAGLVPDRPGLELASRLMEEHRLHSRFGPNWR